MDFLEEKQSSLLICRQCNYFPSTNQLQNDSCLYNVFNAKWVCPVCDQNNEHQTDQKFKVHFFNNNNSSKQLISKSSSKTDKNCILIIISSEIFDLYTRLIPNPQLVRLQQVNKLQMMKQSLMLTAYMNAYGTSLRKKQGKLFSWDLLIKNRQVSKIQYSLWLAQILSKTLSCEVIICSSQGERSYDFEKQNKEKYQYDIVFFNKIFKNGLKQMTNFYCPKLIEYLNTKSFIHCFSASFHPFQENKYLDKLKDAEKVLFILQGQDDRYYPQYSLYNHKQISYEDCKIIYKIPNRNSFNQTCTQLSYVNQISSNIMNKSLSITVFTKKTTQKLWKILLKKYNPLQIPPQKNQKNKTSQLFDSNDRHKNLQSSILQLIHSYYHQFTHLSVQKAQKICYSLKSKTNKNVELKVIIKFNQKNCQYTYLYQKNVFSDKQKPIKENSRKDYSKFIHKPEQDQSYVNILKQLPEINDFNICMDTCIQYSLEDLEMKS